MSVEKVERVLNFSENAIRPYIVSYFTLIKIHARCRT